MKKGFTLIELLLVIAIIAILAVVVFVALNPVKRFTDTRNSRRTIDIENILTAIHSSIVDNKGALPTGLSNGMSEQQLGTAVSGCTLSSGGCSTTAVCLDLSTPLAAYLKSIPTDPKSGTAAQTGYSVVVDANGIVTIKACLAEGTTLSISR